MPVPTSVTLNTGAVMPTVGLGTWKAKPGQVEHAVEYALRNQYRHIDTAARYQNEVEVGQALKASGVPREKVFLTTKINNPDQRRVPEAFRASLEKLDTPYIDLWLMHYPAPMTADGKADKDYDWLDTWKAMEDFQMANPDKVKAIGVSNFSVEYLERLLKAARIVPAVNQIELHPSCPQHDVVEYCQSRGIILTAYSPLGSENSPLLKHEVVNKIAAKHGVHPANVLISLQANKPLHTVLPKSVTNERILNNTKIIDLTQEEIDELQKIDETLHFRACRPAWTGWGSLGFPDCK
ncbi:NADP-dependent oxidoreductase domain-containing protein [Phlebopus sp. FC_14]|nr:NADP-dependent oxidoreductase domain-containing protein [Phlebopus sp. FC_14]